MIDITVYSKEVQYMLNAVTVRLTPLAVATWLGAVVGPYLQSRTRDRFMQEGDDVTGPWAPLKEATVSIRSEEGYGPTHPINRRTGELEEYVTGSSSAFWPTAMGGTVRYPRAPSSRQSVRDKMKTAQQGSPYPKTVVRPVLGMNETDMAFVMTQLSFYITGSRKTMGTDTFRPSNIVASL